MRTQALEPSLIVDTRYRLHREIDHGGICFVFEAAHLVTGRTVAIKLLRDEYATNPEAIARLAREARVLTIGRHPNVVDVLDAGTCGHAGPYMVMELMEGRTLAGILAARQRIPVADAVLVTLAMCSALMRSHENDIAHRDIKPSNVFITAGGDRREIAKLFDYGVAAMEGVEQAAKLTKQGAVIGTPEYMAPEQLKGDGVVGAKTDQYSLAATLYESLCGRAPFEGSYGQILLSMEQSDGAKVDDPEGNIPPALVATLERALSKDPEARFPTMSDFAKSLRGAVGNLPPRTSLLGLQKTDSLADAAPESQTVMAVPKTARRRFARAPYVTPVRVLEVNGSHVDGRTEDISAGGVLVICESVKPAGDVKIRLALPISGRIATISATARWVHRSRGDAAGLEFVDLDADARGEIETYVRAMGGTL